MMKTSCFKKHSLLSGLSLLLVLCLLSALLLTPALAGDAPLLVDDAGLLSSGDADTLTGILERASDSCDMDVVVVTVDSVWPQTTEEYADDYFDYNGYGRGDTNSGILLLLAMEEREWHITTTGAAIYIFSDSDIDLIGECMSNDLSAGNYMDAFTIFADMCESTVADYDGNGYAVDENGNRTYDDGTGHGVTHSNLPIRLVISLVIGLLLSMIPMGILKKQIRNVAQAKLAQNYLRADSLNLTVSRDDFIRETVTRTARPKESSGGGGSSTHVGSSGSSHGGGGGHF